MFYGNMYLMNNNYLNKVIDGEIEELRQASGGRNNALFRVATRLYQFVEGGSFSEEYITNLLFNESSNLKLPYVEIKTTLKSARQKVLGRPAFVPEKNSETPITINTPDPANPPSEIWMDTAKKFMNWAFQNMWYKDNPQAIKYINKRKISGMTAMRYSIGYNPKTLYRSRATWGLSDNDESTTLVIPEGIVIPYYVDKKIWKIEVRSIEGNSKHTIAGSSNSLWGYDRLDVDKPIMLTEGVINGLTIAEYSRMMIQPIALGAITHARKIKFISKLSQANMILVSTDSDDAGETGAAWWLNVLKDNAIRWKPYFGDINDMAMKGIDINEWIVSGLDYAINNLFKDEQKI